MYGYYNKMKKNYSKNKFSMGKYKNMSNKKVGVYQSFNNRVNAWQKIKVMPSGRTKIIAQKQNKPTVKYKNIPVM